MYKYIQGIHKSMVRFQKLTSNSFQLTRAQGRPSAAVTVRVSYALPAVRFSCLLGGRGASCQNGVAAGNGFLCLGWIWLPCGCVSCDPGCTHWRTLINAWETWPDAAADGVRCASLRWEIRFLLTFETAQCFVYTLCICTYNFCNTNNMIS